MTAPKSTGPCWVCRLPTGRFSPSSPWGCGVWGCWCLGGACARPHRLAPEGGVQPNKSAFDRSTPSVRRLSRKRISPFWGLTFWVRPRGPRLERPALPSLLVLSGPDPAASSRLVCMGRTRGRVQSPDGVQTRGIGRDGLSDRGARDCKTGLASRSKPNALKRPQPGRPTPSLFLPDGKPFFALPP